MTETGVHSHLITKAKEEIRRRIRSTRRNTNPEVHQAKCAEIRARLLALETWTSSKSIMLFASMPTEVDLNPLFAAVWTEGRTLLLPRIDKPNLTPCEVTSLDQLLDHGYRILEPSREAPPFAGPIDLIVLPALALDLKGNRLGYGAGYYDRFVVQHPKAIRVAVAFDFQILTDLPHHAGDAPVDFIVTNNETFSVTKQMPPRS